MNSLPLTPEMRKVSRQVLWFETPEQAVVDPIRFASYAMTYGAHEDMKVLRCYLTDDDLREVLSGAPAGIFDARSWAYWNLKMGRYPMPPMPQRTFLTPTPHSF